MNGRCTALRESLEVHMHRDVKNMYFLRVKYFMKCFSIFVFFLKDLKKVFKQVLGTIQSVRKCIRTDNCLKWLCIRQCL